MANIVTYTCKMCGKSFERRAWKGSPERLTCSRECHGRWRSQNLSGKNGPRWKGGRLEKTCPVCNQTFLVYPYAQESAQTCSYECKGVLAQAKIIKACRYCQNDFTVPKGSAQAFCNRACFRAFNVGTNHPKWNPKRDATCSTCGKQFRTQSPNAINRFCGQDCYTEFQRISGPHDYGPNWIDQRRAAIERDGYTCRLCGTSDDALRLAKGFGLDVHHIRPFRLFGYIIGENDNYIEANNPNNLIALCRSCHIRVEHNPTLLS